jgi:hypothetical protein
VLDQRLEMLGRQQAGGTLRLELGRLAALEQQSI